MLRNNLQKRLRMEKLEDKIALAADLSVHVVNGDLIINGDDGVNSFTIERAIEAENAQYRIINQGDVSDTINGEAFTIFYVSGVTRDVKINLGGGDDIFRITGFSTIDESQDLIVPRDLIISGGAGNDQLNVGIFQAEGPFQGPVNVGRNLTVTGNAGDDYYFSTGVDVGGNLTFNDTQGTNQFFSNPGDFYVFGESSHVDGNLSITTGAGNDEVAVQDFVVAGSTTINTAGGDDVVYFGEAANSGTTTVNLGAGSNSVTAEFSDFGGLGIAGSGSNQIFFQFVNANSIVIATAGGNDSVQIFSTTADATLIATLGGADEVAITDSAFDLLLVELGAGSDSLSLTNVDSVIAILSGGGGSDTLTDGGDNDITILLDFGFEVFEEV